MSILGRRSLLLLILFAIAVAAPPLLGTYYTRFATQIAIYGMAALSIDLLLGYTGLITFGKPGLHQRRGATAQYCLFAEQIRFGFFAKRRFDHPRAARANRRRIR